MTNRSDGDWLPVATAGNTTLPNKPRGPQVFYAAIREEEKTMAQKKEGKETTEQPDGELSDLTPPEDRKGGAKPPKPFNPQPDPP